MGVTTRYLGVLAGPFLRDLKRHLLLFDELVVPDLLGQLDQVSDPATRADLEWLSDEGLLSGFNYGSFRDAVLEQDRDSLDGVVRQMAGSYLLIQTAASVARSHDDQAQFNQAIDLGLGGFVVSTLRSVATAIESTGVRACPIIPGFAKGSPEAVLADWRHLFLRVADVLERRGEIERALSSDEDRRFFDLGCRGFIAAAKRFEVLRKDGIPAVSEPTDVVAVTLHALPAVSPVVGLEDIVDFVRDPVMVEQRGRLHRWLTRLATTKITPNELADELTELVGSYRGHMQAARLAYGTTWLEVVVTVPAEIAENLTRFRFGKAASALFALRRARAKLLEAELSTPGREVAYLVQADARFGGS